MRKGTLYTYHGVARGQNITLIREVSSDEEEFDIQPRNLWPDNRSPSPSPEADSHRTNTQSQSQNSQNITSPPFEIFRDPGGSDDNATQHPKQHPEQNAPYPQVPSHPVENRRPLGEIYYPPQHQSQVEQDRREAPLPSATAHFQSPAPPTTGHHTSVPSPQASASRTHHTTVPSRIQRLQSPRRPLPCHSRLSSQSASPPVRGSTRQRRQSASPPFPETIPTISQQCPSSPMAGPSRRQSSSTTHASSTARDTSPTGQRACSNLSVPRRDSTPLPPPPPPGLQISPLGSIEWLRSKLKPGDLSDDDADLNGHSDANVPIRNTGPADSTPLPPPPPPGLQISPLGSIEWLRSKLKPGDLSDDDADLNGHIDDNVHIHNSGPAESPMYYNRPSQQDDQEVGLADETLLLSPSYRPFAAETATSTHHPLYQDDREAALANEALLLSPSYRPFAAEESSSTHWVSGHARTALIPSKHRLSPSVDDRESSPVPVSGSPQYQYQSGSDAGDETLVQSSPPPNKRRRTSAAAMSPPPIARGYTSEMVVTHLPVSPAHGHSWSVFTPAIAPPPTPEVQRVSLPKISPFQPNPFTTELEPDEMESRMLKNAAKLRDAYGNNLEKLLKPIEKVSREVDYYDCRRLFQPSTFDNDQVYYDNEAHDEDGNCYGDQYGDNTDGYDGDQDEKYDGADEDEFGSDQDEGDKENNPMAGSQIVSEPSPDYPRENPRPFGVRIGVQRLQACRSSTVPPLATMAERAASVGLELAPAVKRPSKVFSHCTLDHSEFPVEDAEICMAIDSCWGERQPIVGSANGRGRLLSSEERERTADVRVDKRRRVRR